MTIATRSNTPFQQVSHDAQTALTQFDTRFLMAYMAAVAPWAEKICLMVPGSSIKTTVPIPVFAALFRKFVGESRWRMLSEKSVSMIPEMWQDGVEEDVAVVEAPDWVGWLQQPEAMARAAVTLVNRLFALALEAGTTTLTDLAGAGQYFFGVDKPYLPGGSSADYSNNFPSAGAISTTLLESMKSRFSKIKQPDGIASLGLQLTHIIAPPAQEQRWLNIRDQGYIVQALSGGAQFAQVDNRHRATFELIIAPELTNDAIAYAVAMNGEMRPAVLGESPAETVIVGPDSDFYKEKHRLRFGAWKRAGCALAIPQCIHRYEISA